MYSLAALVAAAETRHGRQGLTTMANESKEFARFYAMVKAASWPIDFILTGVLVTNELPGH